MDSRLRGKDGCSKVSGSGHPRVWRGTLLGGIHSLHRPPWRGIHILPSTPSGRPPQPTVMPAEGDLCVTPPVGDSVAEMASIPSGEPPNLGSRLRGNDGCAKVSGGGHPVVWRGTPLGRHPHPAVNLLGEATNTLPPTPSGRLHSLPSCPRRRASSGLAGHSSREAPTPCRQPPWGGHQYPAANPFGEAPQPTVMPAKAGIQWSEGHSSREAAKLSLRDALIHYRNFMNQSVRKVLTKHERRF